MSIELSEMVTTIRYKRKDENANHFPNASNLSRQNQFNSNENGIFSYVFNVVLRRSLINAQLKRNMFILIWVFSVTRSTYYRPPFRSIFFPSSFSFWLHWTHKHTGVHTSNRISVLPTPFYIHINLFISISYLSH